MAKKMARKGRGKYQRTVIPLKNSSINVYASPRVSEALREVAKDMGLYQGVRLTQLLEAVYHQGTKDGARTAFDAVEQKQIEARRLVPHRTPGRPKKN